MLKIDSVSIVPNPVTCGEDFVISVKIITWDTLKADYTWDSLKNSGETWESLRGGAVDMDFHESSWDATKERYITWNSMNRYGFSWNELSGG